MPRPRRNPERPATGAERVARNLEELRKRGGRRVSVTLSPDEAKRLDEIKAHHNIDNDAQALRLCLVKLGKCFR